MPLPFHKEAAPAADTAMAVYAVGGNAPFWKFIKSVLTQASAMGPTSYDAGLVLLDVDFHSSRFAGS